MGFNDELNKITNDLLGVFFPRKCPFCGRGVDRKSLLCQPCSDTLPRCDRVRQGAGFGRCAAPLYYEDSVRKAILDYKFHGRLNGLDCFGRMMAETAAGGGSESWDGMTT